jgi:hypothetical protein
MSTSVDVAKSKVQEHAKEIPRSPWVEGLARIGYLVRGFLYIVVGIVAVQVALGSAGQASDKRGAIELIGIQPFGKFLLVLVVIGLIGYSLWGFVRAIFDPLRRGTDPKGLAQRVGYLVSGIAYGALVPPTIDFIMGMGQGGNSQSTQDMTAKLLSLPFGQWLAVVVGLVSMAGGLGQIWTGIVADFKKDLKREEMSPTEFTWTVRVGRFGSIARGIIFAMLGFFIVEAALRYDPKEARGLDGALRTIAQQPYGPWLLLFVALGLVSFGVYSALCARRMRIN